MAAESQKGSAINIIFIGFIVGSVLFAGWTGRMKEISDASFESAKASVNLAIGLIGIMALWLGLVRVLEAGGLMFSIARAVRPLMVRLFPDVPPEHPAMGAMILNISANMLGLGNAATPFGIKAMFELNRLNPFPGMATNAMCLFLVINTSSVTIFPLGTIGVRAAAGSGDPAGIFLPTLLATAASTLTGIVAALWLAKRDRAYLETFSERQASTLGGDDVPETSGAAQARDFAHLKGRGRPLFFVLALAVLMFFFFEALRAGFLVPQGQRTTLSDLVSFWLMPFLMLLILLYGLAKGVKVYEAVTEGAKQGFDIAVRIIPFLVAILVAIGMFRASGAMDAVASCLQPLTGLVRMPVEVLPMALVRPLSGSGAFAIMSAIIERAPDSYEAFTASVLMGSTETTFYVLAVYFGAVGITRVRHAIVAALLADAAGIITACLVSGFFWRG